VPVGRLFNLDNFFCYYHFGCACRGKILQYSAATRGAMTMPAVANCACRGKTMPAVAGMALAQFCHERPIATSGPEHISYPSGCDVQRKLVTSLTS
jgi:hypothetical protein